MYVCNCQGVREREISQVIQAGATTMKALREVLGVASCCGKCAIEVREQLQREVRQTRGGECHGCGQGERGCQREIPRDIAPVLC